MTKNKPMKLKKIIPFLEATDKVIIYQDDVYITPSENDEAEEIFNGYVMDIPWYILDFYLHNDENANAIGISKEGFCIYVVENKERL